MHNNDNTILSLEEYRSIWPYINAYLLTNKDYFNLGLVSKAAKTIATTGTKKLGLNNWNEEIFKFIKTKIATGGFSFIYFTSYQFTKEIINEPLFREFMHYLQDSHLGLDMHLSDKAAFEAMNQIIKQEFPFQEGFSVLKELTIGSGPGKIREEDRFDIKEEDIPEGVPKNPSASSLLDFSLYPNLTNVKLYDCIDPPNALPPSILNFHMEYDFIDNLLDLSRFDFKKCSHPCKVYILDKLPPKDQYAKWKYNYIYLKDSSTTNRMYYIRHDGSLESVKINNYEKLLEVFNQKENELAPVLLSPEQADSLITNNGEHSRIQLEEIFIGGCSGPISYVPPSIKRLFLLGYFGYEGFISTNINASDIVLSDKPYLEEFELRHYICTSGSFPKCSNALKKLSLSNFDHDNPLKESDFSAYQNLTEIKLIDTEFKELPPSSSVQKLFIYSLSRSSPYFKPFPATKLDFRAYPQLQELEMRYITGEFSPEVLPDTLEKLSVYLPLEESKINLIKSIIANFPKHLKSLKINGEEYLDSYEESYLSEEYLDKEKHLEIIKQHEFFEYCKKKYFVIEQLGLPKHDIMLHNIKAEFEQEQQQIEPYIKKAIHKRKLSDSLENENSKKIAKISDSPNLSANETANNIDDNVNATLPFLINSENTPLPEPSLQDDHLVNNVNNIASDIMAGLNPFFTNTENIPSLEEQLGL